jgi:transglutaminase-like putative cysteine protease
MIASITVELRDTAATYAASALIVPLGLDTEAQTFVDFDPPPGWALRLVAEERTGQRAALLTPPFPEATAKLRHRFRSGGRALPAQLFEPEYNRYTIAAAELATSAREIAERAGGGHAGLVALVDDANARFTYGQVPMEQRYYYGRDDIPLVGCAAGNCIDINTYLIAGLRAAGYAATYITCYFFPEKPGPAQNGMHCWVRTRHDSVIEDWDIAHFKKLGREDVHAVLNPIPGDRWALAYGRGHRYAWDGGVIELSTPSVPNWVLPDGSTIWPRDLSVTLSKD